MPRCFFSSQKRILKQLYYWNPSKMSIKTRLFGEVLAASLSRAYGVYIELDTTKRDRLVSANGWILEKQSSETVFKVCYIGSQQSAPFASSWTNKCFQLISPLKSTARVNSAYILSRYLERPKFLEPVLTDSTRPPDHFSWISFFQSYFVFFLKTFIRTRQVQT